MSTTTNSFDFFTMYCSETDLPHTNKKTSRKLSLPKGRKIHGSNFVVSISFLIGLALGIPLAFLALHLCDVHPEKSPPFSKTPFNFHNSTDDHERIIKIDVAKPSHLNLLSDVSALKPVEVSETDIALGKHVKLRSSYNANSNTLSNSMPVRPKDHRPRPSTPTLGKKLPKHLAGKLNLRHSALPHMKGDSVFPFPAKKVSVNIVSAPIIDDKNPFLNTSEEQVMANFTRPLSKDASGSNATLEKTVLNLSDIVQDVYWTFYSESLVPKGFDDFDIHAYRMFLNSTQVLKIEEGCGRMQNRLVTFDGGDKSCCRYRHNNDQIQGEIFSFYLGRILGLRNLSPSALALANPRDYRWFSAAPQVALAQWSSERPLVLTKFIEDLRPAYIPRHFQTKNQTRLHPIAEDLQEQDLSNLVQWSDLIVFDYLTANLDRTINNMYNERWNRDMMRQPAHNLAATPEGLLLFLDNESGLLHGYRLLEKYEHFHKSLLDGLCVFRRSTVAVIERLHKEDNVGSVLKKAFLDGEPGMSEWLAFLPDKSVRILKDRISTVYNHIQNCKLKFEPIRTASSISVSDTPHR